MNFSPLFLTASVINAIYKIILTLWLLYHLTKRMINRDVPRNGRTNFSGRSHHRGALDGVA